MSKWVQVIMGPDLTLEVSRCGCDEKSRNEFRILFDL